MNVRLEPYRVHPLVLPDTVRREDLGAAAWWALLHDGVVRRLWGDVAIAADLVDTPALRAVGLASLVPARGVVGRQSAVWLHTGQFSPRRVDVLVTAGGRRADPHPLRTTAESGFGPGDIVRLGEVRATTVQRTGVDVCRNLPADEAVPMLEALRSVGFDVGTAIEQLKRLGGHRGVQRARDVLSSL